MEEIKELRQLFEENVLLGRWANAQAMITEVSKKDVVEANKWAVELKDAQDNDEEVAREDEQMRHKETPEY